MTQRIISPQPGELQTLCPGEEVNIVCETRGSSSIAWASNVYIEQGGNYLISARIDSIGETQISTLNPNTIATLINNAIENEVTVLVSQLHIIASIDSFVTCIQDNGAEQTISIQLLGM